MRVDFLSETMKARMKQYNTVKCRNKNLFVSLEFYTWERKSVIQEWRENQDILT